jgi:hypothetical protein
MLNKGIHQLLEKLMPVFGFFFLLILIAGLFFLVVRYAWSAPFLVCDPYPATGQQPTEFVVTVSGIATPVVTPAVETQQGKILKLDLGPLNLSGSRTVTAKARNSWGESADSSPFIFTAGRPASPSGITLSATE